jgi:ribosomal protein S18 acetylase RimI-like enzyme
MLLKFVTVKKIGMVVTQFLMVHPGPLSEVTVPTLDPVFTLRLATPQDADDLAELMAEAYEEPWDSERVLREFLGAQDVSATWIVTDSDGVVAVASERMLPTTYPGAGYVHYVGARRRARGHRLGALVTAQCLRGFARRGLESAVLETDDFRARAVVTYLRLGFVPSYRSVEEQTAWSVLFPTLLEKRS